MGFGLSFTFLIFLSVKKKFGWLLALLISYLLISCGWVICFNQNRYAHVEPNYLAALKLFSAESALKLLLIVLPLVALDFKDLRSVGRRLSIAYCIISVGQIFWESFFYGCGMENSCGGPLRNPSLNSGMMTVILPIAAAALPSIIHWPLAACVCATILIGKSSVGIGMFSLYLAFQFVSKKTWPILLLIPFLFAFGAHFWGSRELFSFGDRDVMWKFFMTMWAHNPRQWIFGTGFGTFGIFSRLSQDHFEMRPQYWWIWLHNDWLQGIFETGIVGAALMVGVFLQALYRLFKKGMTPEARALGLFGVTMGCNFPLHIGLPCAFVAWLTYLGLLRENRE